MKTTLAALLAGALLVAACSPAATTAPGSSPGPTGSPGPVPTGIAGVTVARADVPRASTDPAAAIDAGAAVTAFGLELYRAIDPGAPNTVFSPTSIALALALARAGARGQTAAEMDAVMHDLAADDNATWLNALDQALAARSGTFADASGQRLEIALRIANAAFAQRGMPLEDAYLDALASRHGAGVQLVDYVTATEAARGAINRWVADQTEQRIPELLVPGVLTPLSRLTLVNAIYLKAPWLMPFDSAETEPGPFTRADGSTVDVPMMSVSDAMRTASGAGWTAVEIPYLGGDLAMTVIVPADLAAFETSLTAEALSGILVALGAAQVNLALPRFSIETKASLADVLAALGMPTAFGDGADFSGITLAEQLQIADVIHQANIDVDEEGTEAAAATAVVMEMSALPAEPVTVRVDRPFLYLVRDLPTGAVLFMGRVGDPSIGR